MKILKGIAASPGIVIGKAYLLDSEEMSIPQRSITAASIPKEITRFQDALTQTRAEIQTSTGEVRPPLYDAICSHGNGGSNSSQQRAAVDIAQTGIDCHGRVDGPLR